MRVYLGSLSIIRNGSSIMTEDILTEDMQRLIHLVVEHLEGDKKFKKEVSELVDKMAKNCMECWKKNNPPTVN